MANYDLPRAILGKDFISPEEVMESRKDIAYTEEQHVRFGETVPPQEILEWCRDNSYILIPGPNRPMSLLEIRDLQNGYFYSKENPLDKVKTRWSMIRKESFLLSIYRNWEEQQSLLSEVETVPSAVEFLWMITTYKAVRGSYLFCGIYVRTSSLDSDGNNIYVSVSHDKGPIVCYHWDGDRDSSLGLVVARKLP